MKNLLYLVHRLPYPPNKGDKISSFNLLRYFASRYRVFLGAFVDDPEDRQYLDKVRAYCADACFVDLNPRTAKIASLRGLLSGEALTLAHRVGQFFSVHLVEQRFVVEQIQLGRPPTHKEVNHALGLCCVMLVSKDSLWRGVGTFGLHQVLQAQGTQTHCGTAQKRSTACKVCAGDIHGCFWGVRNE